MKTSDFDYYLPEELIAQTPLKVRDTSRLMVVKKSDHLFEDHQFTDLLDYLRPGDALVLNETKVLPARICGTKDTGGKIELLLLKELEKDTWQCLARPQKRLKPGTKISFSKDLSATVKALKEDGLTDVQFTYQGIFLEHLQKLGTMPLPPYIKTTLKDQSRYQTVYASTLGSAAAPTAGLHFTESMLKKIEQKGVKIVKITLHVGLGTFRPVQTENLKDHPMHSEFYEISPQAAKALNQANRVIAVGTTSVRALESNLEHHQQFTPEARDTNIFIYPGYHFRAIDGLITNFHLPKSTLLMLVSAFAGQKIIKEAYAHAVAEKYRFFSFGDAMLII